VHGLCKLSLTPPELAFLKSMPFMKTDYLEFLRLFKLNPDFVHIYEKDGQLEIEAEGPALYTMPFEIYLLEIVQELYTSDVHRDIDFTEAVHNLDDKIKVIQDYVSKGGTFKFTDFGGRRRFNKQWHYKVVSILNAQLGPKCFTGTSNLKLAHVLDIPSIGTQAHEVYQLAQALTRIEDSQKYMLQAWASEYRGALDTALTDTLGVDKFIKDLDLYFAKLYNCYRHDSGDPYIWGDKIINHLLSMGINTKAKTLVFSDGLTVHSAIALAEYFKGRVNVSFGIGTHLTNDMGPGVQPLQNVMKMTTCNGKPVAKISDTLGKTMCEDDEYIRYLKKVIA